MNWNSYHLTATKEIEKELNELLTQWKKNADQKTHTQVTNLFASFDDSIFGGKFIRGTLVKLGYELCADKNSHHVLPISAAIEIVHASMLIHDDIIDKSPIRRGKPSLYTKLGNNDYGKSQAMLIGDIGFFLSFGLLAQLPISITRIKRLQSVFSTLILDTVYGEMLDVEFSKPNTIVSEELIFQIARLKTARYSIVLPLLLGGIAAGASKTRLKNFELFGETLGIAFQIKDDILGIFGNEKLTGKSIISDITEGKQTLLLYYARQKATPAQQKILDTYYGNLNNTFESYGDIREIFIQSGAKQYAENVMQEYTNKAIKIIPQITQDNNKQKILTEFIQYLLEREK